MSTFLNTPRQDLWTNIKRCWASLFSRRAIHYLRIKSNYYAQEAEKLYRQKVNDFTDSSQLKGIVANRGGIISVRGRARILECNNVIQARELKNNFQKGDILVTAMAQLNTWNLLELASAIVTDEGGMLSHAAILAREMNIPCIVGTHSATSVIKDGNLIIIDTIKGTVQ